MGPGVLNGKRSEGERPWWTWHLFAVLLIVLAPSQLWLGDPVWSLDRGLVGQAVGMGGLYVLAAVAVPVVVQRLRLHRALAVVLVSASFLAPLLLVLIALEPRYSRGVVVAGSALFVALLAMPVLLGRFRAFPTLALAGGASALLVVGITADDEPFLEYPEGVPVTIAPEDVAQIESQFHTIQARYYPFREATAWGRGLERFEEGLVWGGGLARFGDDFLVATGHGSLFHLESRGRELTVTRLARRVPINRDAFASAVGPEVNEQWFRVSDLQTQDLGDRIRLVASHHHWNADDDCFVLRFSELILDRDTAVEALMEPSGESGGWRVLHDTRPCLPLKDQGHPFAGHHGGGRIEVLNDTALLVTVGDHEFDGLNAAEALPQARDNDYGKTLVLPLGEGEPHTFTIGHRNPQGLFVDSDGTVWSTEHGPRGGDELNRLVEGANYGWPVSTRGTQYGELWWPLQDESDGSEGIRTPEFVWTPAIAPSNLRVVESERFSRWQDDLLVGSLTAGSFFRVHRQDDRVVSMEPIPIERRIRDFVEGPDGELVVWADRGWFVTLAPVEGEAEESLVRICTDCHGADGARPGLGPDLRGVVGRPIAADEGFPYSSALRSMEGTWTEDRLHRFLADPSDFAPGTTMRTTGIEDEDQREAIIEYLRDMEN